MKRQVAKIGVELASKKLGLSELLVEFKNQTFFNHPSINAIFNQDIYAIIFSIDWINQASELEILKCAFHETRHAYQKACTQFPELLEIDVDDVTVKIWYKEFKSYKNPNHNEYLEQEIEKDAIKFSEDLLNEIIMDT